MSHLFLPVRLKSDPVSVHLSPQNVRERSPDPTPKKSSSVTATSAATSESHEAGTTNAFGLSQQQEMRKVGWIVVQELTNAV